MAKDREEQELGEDIIQDLFGPQSEIAEKLKQFYTGIQEEEIPERFLDLLEKLDQAEEAAEESSKEGS
ncbi:NepR family anti-sigma factor [Bartonella sp. DGB2]|uniref:NepR family anti-sigma factor n=1 Tax=Bartonella sp. DGB2 TaxID=3388426 RepID=UPI00399006C7